MNIAAKQVEAFLRELPKAIQAVLFYGPDSGLVRERLQKVLKQIVEDPNDPFRVVEVTGDQLTSDTALLADEAAALSFTGGRRVIRVREARDSLAKLFDAYLKDPAGDALILVEAGELQKRSDLRKVFEKHDAAAALACYRDEGRDIGEVLRSVLKEAGLTAERDAAYYIIQRLGEDRQASRREIEKLVLYKGDDKSPVTLEDAEVCIGDSSAQAVNSLAVAVGSGNLRLLSRTLKRSLDEGLPGPVILRSVGQHFQRLHLASSLMAEGASIEGALKEMRPPIFWRDRDSFIQQLRLWRQQDLALALQRLLEAERVSKSASAPPVSMAADLLFRLCAHAARARS